MEPYYEVLSAELLLEFSFYYLVTGMNMKHKIPAKIMNIAKPKKALKNPR